MPPPALLSDAEIAQRLRSLLGWERRGQALVRTFRFPDFRAALAFVNRVAEPAEEQRHHPDVEIRWNTVTLTLSTHASGGITERDFRLAEAIEGLEGAA
ncbi:MAG TPA: 4a-hydroxytetrahydrobiopterin dehydratase [Candidatus Limnocylindrales bacterium]|nr:4a-hydroxytetrahydrobiopterin dehydratase [Candidatus Limnocylindrales bacterium]